MFNLFRKINIPEKVNYLTINYLLQKENRDNNIRKYIKETCEKSVEKFKNKDVSLVYKINNSNQMNLIKNNNNFFYIFVSFLSLSTFGLSMFYEIFQKK